MTRTEGISPWKSNDSYRRDFPWKSNTDAVPASCILPGRAPIRTILQKNDDVEAFCTLSRLGICVFQKHCITKLRLELLNAQTKLTNEKIYLL